MSKEFRSLTTAFTVKDCEDLPGDMYADDAVEVFAEALYDFIEKWYAEEGHHYFVGMPII